MPKRVQLQLLALLCNGVRLHGPVICFLKEHSEPLCFVRIAKSLEGCLESLIMIDIACKFFNFNILQALAISIQSTFNFRSEITPMNPPRKARFEGKTSLSNTKHSIVYIQYNECALSFRFQSQRNTCIVTLNKCLVFLFSFIC